MAKRQPIRTSERPTPDTPVFRLAQMAIVDALTGPELAVYLRLLGAWKQQKSRTVVVHNAALYRESRTAVRALRSLENMGVVTIRFDGSLKRTIEVHP